MSRPGREEVDALLAAAREARERAYAPYSGFHVGAAVLAEDGGIYSGCNVENASYPLAVCGERTAVQKAVSEGVRRIVAVAVVTSGDGVAWPCGGCRQVLHEFGADPVVVAEGRNGERRERPLRELLPEAFGPGDLDVAP